MLSRQASVEERGINANDTSSIRKDTAADSINFNSESTFAIISTEYRQTDINDLADIRFYEQATINFNSIHFYNEQSE